MKREVIVVIICESGFVLAWLELASAFEGCCSTRPRALPRPPLPDILLFSSHLSHYLMKLIEDTKILYQCYSFSYRLVSHILLKTSIQISWREQGHFHSSITHLYVRITHVRRNNIH